MVRILPPGETEEQTKARLTAIGHSPAEAEKIAKASHVGKDHGGVKTVSPSDHQFPDPGPRPEPTRVDPGWQSELDRKKDERRSTGAYSFGPGGHPITHTPDGKGGYTSSPVVPGDHLTGDAALYARPIAEQLADLSQRQEKAWSHEVPQAYMKPGEWEFMRDRIANEMPHLLQPPDLDNLQVRSAAGRPIHGAYHQPTGVVGAGLQDAGMPSVMAQIIADRSMSGYGLGQHASELSMPSELSRAIDEQRIAGHYGALPSGFDPRYWDGGQGELNPLKVAIGEHKQQLAQGRYVYIDSEGNEHYTDDPQEASQKGTLGWYIAY